MRLGISMAHEKTNPDAVQLECENDDLLVPVDLFEAATAHGIRSAEALYCALLTFPTYCKNALNLSTGDIANIVLDLRTHLASKVPAELLQSYIPEQREYGALPPDAIDR